MSYLLTGPVLKSMWNIRQAKFETTAAEAERDAPNPAIAQEIETNAENIQATAEQAAAAASVCFCAYRHMIETTNGIHSVHGPRIHRRN